MPEKNIKILIADDFKPMRTILKNILKELGYLNVVAADDGSTALEKLKVSSFDFVMTDWDMPMSGIELIKAIRGNFRLRRIPILMITSKSESSNIGEALEAGVNDYIVKPFTAARLKESIDSIFEKSAA